MRFNALDFPCGSGAPDRRRYPTSRGTATWCFARGWGGLWIASGFIRDVLNSSRRCDEPSCNLAMGWALRELLKRLAWRPARPANAKDGNGAINAFLEQTWDLKRMALRLSRLQEHHQRFPCANWLCKAQLNERDRMRIACGGEKLSRTENCDAGAFLTRRQEQDVIAPRCGANKLYKRQGPGLDE